MAGRQSPPARKLAALPGRALLFPGPQPPLSHFGLTLLRHVVATGLRYALYQLGLPAPGRPPLRMDDLRLSLDAPVLASLLADIEGGPEVLGALLDPGGSAVRRLPGRLAGAVVFHRLRLGLRPSRPRPGRAPHDASADPWSDFRRRLTGLLAGLNDALLAEVLAALERRRRRGRGEDHPPCLGPEAWRFRMGASARLENLGPPDPLHPAWSVARRQAEEARQALATEQVPARHRHRGGFRERYRGALNELTPIYESWAARAVDDGALAAGEDAFFLPFDLAGELASPRAAGWIRPAVEVNRREYDDLLGDSGAQGEETRTAPLWRLAPLRPLL